MIYVEVNERMKYFGEICELMVFAYNQDSINRL